MAATRIADRWITHGAGATQVAIFTGNRSAALTLGVMALVMAGPVAIFASLFAFSVHAFAIGAVSVVELLRLGLGTGGLGILMVGVALMAWRAHRGTTTGEVGPTTTTVTSGVGALRWRRTVATHAVQDIAPVSRGRWRGAVLCADKDTRVGVGTAERGDWLVNQVRQLLADSPSRQLGDSRADDSTAPACAATVRGSPRHSHSE